MKQNTRQTKHVIIMEIVRRAISHAIHVIHRLITQVVIMDQATLGGKNKGNN